MLLYAKQQICDWDGFDALFAQQHAALARPDAPSSYRIIWSRFATRPQSCSRPHVVGSQATCGHSRLRAPALAIPQGARLRIGYLGSDFRAHPLANLLSEVIERHDRTRFEVHGYSFGPDDGSPERARFARAFDYFVDVRAETFEQTAQRIRNDGIAILFDTSGYVIYARSEIFALRPAPIQINCIGFPGTLGADYYDYIMTDHFVTPPAQQANFAERFMVLPHCYMPGDGKRAIGAIPTRAQCGLPESGFVFCCFNASYKILPDIFAVWMRLLRENAGSTLWLYEDELDCQRQSAPGGSALRRRARTIGLRATPSTPGSPGPARPCRSVPRHLSLQRAHDGQRCAVRRRAPANDNRRHIREPRIG